MNSECGRGWAKRCANARSRKCKCRCGGINHGTTQQLQLNFAMAGEGADLWVPSDEWQMEEWNPRYATYARAHQMTPEQRRAADVTEFPGGRNTGFVVWIAGRWNEWDALNGRRYGDHKSEADHANFDAWLETKYPTAS